MITLDVIIIGLLIGSFLNVLIYRIPMVIEWEWRHSSRECLGLPQDLKDLKPSSFYQGRSFCPHCHHQLSAFQNIPVLSFIFLKGRCQYCKHPISWRYPIVEVVSAFLFYGCYHYFGLSLGGFLFLTALMCWWVLFWIDAQTYLLPDEFVYTSLWVGLLSAALKTSPLVNAAQAIEGAVIAWLGLWLFAKIYQGIRKKEGMGHGDFKLLSALAVWVGPWGILPIILVATILGSLWAMFNLIQGQDKNHPIPFGPFLILAGVLVWVFPHLWQPYLVLN